MPFYMVPEEPVQVVIGDTTFQAEPKKFKTGSVGWYLGGKIKIGDMRVQLSMSLVIVGSKPPAELIDVETVDDLTPGLFEAQKPPKKPSRGKGKSKPSEGEKVS